MSKAVLLLEDGKIFHGSSFGADVESTGEVLFNTSLTGYQEILTDPSYKGQIVVMTYPHIGNYGIVKDDFESRGVFVSGFVVKEYSQNYSNWRANKSLGKFLQEHHVAAIEGIDTRALTKHLRDHGAKQGILSTKDFDVKSLMKKLKSAPGLVGVDLVKEVVMNKTFEWNEDVDPEWKILAGLDYRIKPAAKLVHKHRVVAIDCGIKYNILRCLKDRKCQVFVVPATATYDEIMKFKPDGVLVSNGPGDPEGVPYVIETLQKLIAYNTKQSRLKQVAIFGICLGQQILGLAFGGKTYKLKFGHHGANHPVKDLATGRIEITTQNHGFCVDIKTLPKEVKITHINLNDQSLEGMEHTKLPIFSVQYHPEASAGPHDSRYLFDRFIEKMDGKFKVTTKSRKN